MNNKYDVVIGIEIHLELNSNTKIFSPGPIIQDAKPNTTVNKNDIGLIGTLPVVNKQCVILGLQACSLLNFKIDPILRFDRKNYSYFDLPKGYQITQQFFPIGRNGKLTISLPNNITKDIKLDRVHLEEDTAKQISKENNILLDYNRAGIGLIEVVTEPVINDSTEAAAYVAKLQELMSYSKISKAKMNEGSMRCDINISLKNKNQKELGQKVEIKNLNSINNIKLAIEYEIKRQSQLLDSKIEISSETRKFDENSKKTILMRKKSSGNDYHFFPEPNINPIKLSQKFIDKAISMMPKSINIIKESLTNKYNLNDNQIKVLISNSELLNFFSSSIDKCVNHNLFINYFFTDLLGYLNKNNKKLSDTKLTSNNFIELIKHLDSKKISSNQGKDILRTLFTKDSPISINDISQIDNDEEIEKILLNIIENNKNLLSEYETRKERVLKFYIGQAMKITKGKLNPIKAKNILENLILKQNKK